MARRGRVAVHDATIFVYFGESSRKVFVRFSGANSSGFESPGIADTLRTLLRQFETFIGKQEQCGNSEGQAIDCREPSSCCTGVAKTAPCCSDDLALVVRTWPKLPNYIRAAMLMMAKGED